MRWSVKRPASRPWPELSLAALVLLVALSAAVLAGTVTGADASEDAAEVAAVWEYQRLRSAPARSLALMGWVFAAVQLIALLGLWAFALRPAARRLQSQREQLELFGRAIAAAPDGVLIADARRPDQPIAHVNPAFEELTGYTAEETLGRNCRFLQGDDRDQPGLAELRRAIGEGRPATVLLRNYRKDGTRFWNRLAVSPVRNAGGDVTHYIGTQTDVTERKRLEASLLHYFEQSDDLFCTATFDGYLQELSPAWERTLGYEPAELRSRSSFELVHPDDRERTVGESRRLAEGGRVVAFSNRYRTKDGRYRWLQWNAAAIPEEKIFYATARDVTDARAAAARIEEWKTRYEAVLTASGHVVYEWDPRSNAVTYGGSLRRTLDYSAEDLSHGLSEWLELVHPDDREAFEAEIARVAAAETAFSLQYRVRRKDGRYLVVRDEGHFVTDRDGRARMIGLVIDVTEREKLESQVRERAELMRLVTDGLPVAILYLDSERRLRFANQTFCDWYGLEREELIGRRIGESSRPESLELIAPHVAAVLAGRTITFEERCVLPDGVERDLRATLVPHREVNGVERSVGLHGMIEDVTERRGLEKQLQVSQKLEAVGRLAGGVAHDFNNLLSVVLGQSDVLTRRMSSDDPARQRVGEIREAAGRAADLTRQLLTFSRRQVIEPRIIGINDTIREMDKLLRRLVGDDVSLHLDLQPGVGDVRMDPSQLEQVLVNLVVNARDAMPRGGELRIATAPAELDEEVARRFPDARAGRYVAFTVSDTGTGMDATTRSRLFEPFFTTKGENGTGLGLATVYGIVKESRGGIAVDSEPGRGTSLRIYFPRFDPVAAPREAAPAAAELPRGSETVLVVEDEAALRKIAVESLRACGYDVLEAADGRAALELARSRSGPIHLLLTDVVMPRLSGRELAETLCAIRPDVRVLYTSGYTDDIVVKHGISRGESAFLQKPYTLASLAEAVRDALSRGAAPVDEPGGAQRPPHGFEA